MSSSDLAGFWLRFVAFVIDSIVLAVIYLLLIVPVYGYFFPEHFEGIDEMDPSAQVDLVSFTTFSSIINFSQVILLLVFVLYHALMESSRYQGSLGKLALELHVTNIDGARVSFSKSLLRNVSKLFSTLVFMMGFVMAAFTRKKQALHDLMAGTLVIKN